MVKSRRKAREAALRALYEIEIGGTLADHALQATLEDTSLSEDHKAFVGVVVRGVLAHKEEIDAKLAELTPDYDFKRIATVDRNLMRLASFELLHLPAIPPAVTLNEAIEIAKRYSTAESGRFVNGVLGRLLKDTAKANWDPATAPVEEFEEHADAEPEPEIETVEEGSPEEAEMKKIGAWRIGGQS